MIYFSFTRYTHRSGGLKHTALVLEDIILNAVGESLKEPNIDSLHSKKLQIKISELNCGFSVLSNV